MQYLEQTDPQVAHTIAQEEQRQQESLVLIASENYASPAVLQALGTSLSNKYAEGYPGQRYYGGCSHVDAAEELAIERVKKLFGAEHANVQPHSGTQANMAAYAALLEPGDTVLGMRLDQGGHLSHGHPINFSGRLYNFIPYGLDQDTECIDYAAVAQLAKEHQPKALVAGCSAYSRVVDFRRFREIADEVGSVLIADISHIAGLVAVGVHPPCLPYAHVVTSTTHKTLRGPRGAFILSTQALARKIDRAVFPGIQGGPMMHAIAAKAVCFGEALKPEFTVYQERVLDNARTLAAGLEKGGVRIIAGGTDNHLVLVDLRPLNITGQAAENALENVNISVNKNAIPSDPRPPSVTSGLRLGTPALTTRGFGKQEFNQVAEMISRILKGQNDSKVHEQVKEQVRSLARDFPVSGFEDPRTRKVTS